MVEVGIIIFLHTALTFKKLKTKLIRPRCIILAPSSNILYIYWMEMFTKDLSFSNCNACAWILNFNNLRYHKYKIFVKFQLLICYILKFFSFVINIGSR